VSSGLSRNDAEVIVVGGGPAGATAAHFLAGRGIEVLLLDRATFPRSKPCGGGVPARTAALLDFDVTPVFENTVRSLVLSCGKEEVRFDDVCNVHMVDRAVFDAFLLGKAKAAGAAVREGEAVTGVLEERGGVTVSTAHGRYRAARVVGADGGGSVVAKAAGLARKRKGVAVAVRAELPPERFRQIEHTARFDMLGIPKGYLWIFPKKGYLACGAGTIKKKFPGLKKRCEAFVTARAELGITGITHEGAAVLPCYGGAKKFHTKRIILVGDAASLVDPLTGEGIYYAIKSALLAAETIAGGQPASAYSQLVRAEICEDLAFAGRYARAYALTPKFVMKKFMRSARCRRYLDLFARLCSGGETYKGIYAKMRGKRAT